MDGIGLGLDLRVGGGIELIIIIKISFESLTFCHQYTQTSLSDIAEIKSKLTSMKRVFPNVQSKLTHFYSFKIGVTSLKRVTSGHLGTLVNRELL